MIEVIPVFSDFITDSCFICYGCIFGHNISYAYIVRKHMAYCIFYGSLFLNHYYWQEDSLRFTIAFLIWAILMNELNIKCTFLIKFLLHFINKLNHKRHYIKTTNNIFYKLFSVRTFLHLIEMIVIRLVYFVCFG